MKYYRNIFVKSLSNSNTTSNAFGSIVQSSYEEKLIIRPKYSYEKTLSKIIYFTKGQLISKCPFGAFKSSKKPTKFFPEFLP